MLSSSSIPLLLVLVATGVTLHAARNWKSLPLLRRMVALQFLFISLHILEEHFGGFVDMVQAHLHFTLRNRTAGNLITAVLVLVTFLPPLIVPRNVYLAMAPMLLGVLELVAHTLAGFTMSDTPIPYSPGLVTAALLLFPVSVFSIRYAIRNKLMRPGEWLLSLLIVVLALLSAQYIVVTSSGMAYVDFVRNVRNAMFGPFPTST